MCVRCEVSKQLRFARGPADFQALDTFGVSESEMDQVWHLRTITIDREHLAHQLLPLHDSLQPRADAKPVALMAAQRNLQVVPLREMILVQQQWPAAHLANQQV